VEAALLPQALPAGLDLGGLVGVLQRLGRG
jgi:hypothetical protein